MNDRPDAGSARPRLLAGGNPQIAKGDGDAPVRAYIAAMPGWKRAAGERLDRLIERTIPGALIKEAAPQVVEALIGAAVALNVLRTAR